MAKMKGGKGRIEVDDNRMFEVRSWSINEAPTEVDTSVLDNLDGAGEPVARTEAGANKVTMSLSIYVDSADTAQELLQVTDAAGREITLYPGGVGSGLPEYQLSDCKVSSRAESASDINQYVGGEIGINVNGGLVRAAQA